MRQVRSGGAGRSGWAPLVAIIALGLTVGCERPPENEPNSKKETHIVNAQDATPVQPWHGLRHTLRPGEIRVGGEIGRRMDLTLRKNLLALNLDGDFLKPFQQRVPFPWSPEALKEFKKKRMLFIGTGETLDALVFFAAYSGDAEIVALKERLLEALLATQDPSGYIGQFVAEPGDRQVATDFAFEDASNIALALANDALYFDSERSRTAAARLIRCLVAAHRACREAGGKSFSGIGFTDAAWTMYAVTRDKEFLSIARHTEIGPARTSNVESLHDWVDDPLFQAGWHKVATNRKAKQSQHQGVIDDGTSAATSGEKRLIWHVYRNMERMVSQMKLHGVEPDERYLRMTRRVYAALVRPQRSGMVITGGIGRHEGWSEDQDCGSGLGETCASAFSLMFFDELTHTDGDLRYGDLMERVIYNHLFAAQEPAGRKLRYFTPASGPRTYYDHDIFCCPGNYRRALSRMPQFVYSRFQGGIAVNLYTESEADIRLADDLRVALKQTTRYPSDGRVELVVSPSRPARFRLTLRMPRWCEAPQVLLNGRPAEATLDREWRAGDRVEVQMPMRWRFVAGREMQAGRAALMRGPLVFGLSRQANRLPAEMVLRDITLDPKSIEEPVADSEVRPDGLAALIHGWSPGRATSEEPDLRLRLTEFPDPDSEEIYFRLADPTAAKPDELLESR